MESRYDGREVGVTRATPFATPYIDLNCPMEMWVRGPFDYLHYYFSKDLLERIALDNSISPAFQLQEVFFIEDLVVAQMTKSILAPIRHGEPLDRLALDHIAMVLGAHTLQQHCGTPKSRAFDNQVSMRGRSCVPRRCCGQVATSSALGNRRSWKGYSRRKWETVRTCRSWG